MLIIKSMFISNYLLSFLIVIPCRQSLFTHWSRSPMIRMKERCGQTLLLNNNFWLLQETARALTAIEKNEYSFDALPWTRLRHSIQQIYNACSIDRNLYVKERKHQQNTLVRTGTYLVEKSKTVSHPSLIEFSNG